MTKFEPGKPYYSEDALTREMLNLGVDKNEIDRALRSSLRNARATSHRQTMWFDPRHKELNWQPEGSRAPNPRHVTIGSVDVDGTTHVNEAETLCYDMIGQLPVQR